jgi:hypothetical protein
MVVRVRDAVDERVFVRVRDDPENRRDDLVDDPENRRDDLVDVPENRRDAPDVKIEIFPQTKDKSR